MSSVRDSNERDDLLEDILREYAETHPASTARASSTTPSSKADTDALAAETVAAETVTVSESVTPAAAAEDERSALYPLLGTELPEEERMTETKRAQKVSPANRFFCKNSALWRILEWFAPKHGDQLSEILRKLCFIVALCVLLGSVTYLVNDTFLIPYSNALTVDSVGLLYTPGQPQPLTPEEENYTGYPEEMSDDFKKLYYANNDVRGWISYPSTSTYWYGIDYPVVQAQDNDFYLHRDFYKTENKNGTLFFDHRNDFSSPNATNKMTIIYGHNMRSGQMFASLNRLVFNLGFARSAPVVYLNTLYDTAQYKVFAVFVMDEDEEGRWNYLRTQFTDDSMANYLEEVKLRTLYFYDDVDVDISDEFLLLYTCGNSSQNELKNGRTIVLARRLREGESISTNTSLIRNNPDPLMPKAWYTAQGKELPAYYTGIEPGTTTTTTPSGDTTTTLDPNGDSSGETATTTPEGEGGETTTTLDPNDNTTTTTPEGEGGETTTTLGPNGETTATVPEGEGGETTTTMPVGEGGETTTTLDPNGETTTTVSENSETGTTTEPTTTTTEVTATTTTVAESAS